MSASIRVVLFAAAIALLLLGGRETAVSADDAPQLPTGCWSGQVVVAASSGRFACVDLREALRLSGCNDGDFLTWDSSGHLACTRPNVFSSGSRGLLPECSSGEILVSEGFGRWRCAGRD
ncbi:MAG: hypothetical protein GYA57_12695 [Myxococcales bacterium]|nr:hypothetical protein [Myxococcales bacterium]